MNLIIALAHKEIGYIILKECQDDPDSSGLNTFRQACPELAEGLKVTHTPLAPIITRFLFMS